jgi:hypothetical protein
VTELQQRLDMLLARLRTTYDGIGHSSGRPYVYYVYPPEREKMVFRMVDDATSGVAGDLGFVHVDLLPLIVQATAGQGAAREELLGGEKNDGSAAQSIVRLWAGTIRRHAGQRLAEVPAGLRPVLFFRGLAALHPLGNPTGLMELLAEKEIRDPRTDVVVPIVVLVPGTRPPQTSRTYDFLGLESLRFTFYRGEEA